MLARVITSANLGVGDDQSAVIQHFDRYPSVQRITTHRMRAFLVLVGGDGAVLVIDDTACGPVECKSSLPISAVVLVGTNRPGSKRHYFCPTLQNPDQPESHPQNDARQSMPLVEPVAQYPAREPKTGHVLPGGIVRL
jgi:hypothetical protein